MWVYINVGIHQCGYTSMWVYINVGIHQCGYTSMWVYINVGIRMKLPTEKCVDVLAPYLHQTPRRIHLCRTFLSSASEAEIHDLQYL